MPLNTFKAPWPMDIVLRLNKIQADDHFHGYTCGEDSKHGKLLATRQGWVCQSCGYKQDWAHLSHAVEMP